MYEHLARHNHLSSSRVALAAWNQLPIIHTQTFQPWQRVNSRRLLTMMTILKWFLFGLQVVIYSIQHITGSFTSYFFSGVWSFTHFFLTSNSTYGCLFIKYYGEWYTLVIFWGQQQQLFGWVKTQLKVAKHAEKNSTTTPSLKIIWKNKILMFGSLTIQQWNLNFWVSLRSPPPPPLIVSSTLFRRLLLLLIQAY